MGTYYDTYAAHRIFDLPPDLGITSVLTLGVVVLPCAPGWLTRVCVVTGSQAGTPGTLIRSIIQGGVAPAPLTLRAEVLQVVRECATQYGFGSPFVTEQYLRERTPVLSMSYGWQPDKCAPSLSKKGRGYNDANVCRSAGL